MKSIITADIHLSLYSQDNIIGGISRRLHFLRLVLFQMAYYAEEHGIKYFIIAGDTLHNKSIIHAIAMSVLLNFIRSFPDLIFIIIDGNHDMSSKSGDGVSALMSLDNEPNVKMIHEAEEIENISFVPWSPKKMKDDIKNAPKGNYLVSHFGLNEAMLNSGISIVSDIGLNDLKKFKHCFIGHYHLPQEIGNVTIPGSGIQLDWGEKDEDKRFIVFDSDTGVIESVLTEHYQKHIELEINEDNVEEIIKKAKELKDEGNFVKLLKIDGVDVSKFEKGFQIVDKTVRDITNRGIDSTMSLEDKLLAYLKIKEIPIDMHEDYIKEAKNIIDRIV